MPERRKNLKLSTPNDIRKALSRIANMVLNNEMDTKTANSLTVICNAILSSLRTDEYREAVEQLEVMLEERKEL